MKIDSYNIAPDLMKTTTNYQKLKKHIVALATLPETEAPVISAYFAAGKPRSAQAAELESWASVVRHSFRGRQGRDFEEALEEIVDHLETVSTSQGLAVFSRWGDYPMFLPLQFGVPLETFFQAGRLPAIYPLVELKDRFNRFVLVVTNSEAARIYEINLGEVSESLLAERPGLRERLGREWTREHYQNHRRHRDQQFLKEKVAIIEQIMAKRGHNALVLAGEPRFVSRLRNSLPKHLQSRIAGEIRAGVRKNALPAVISESIQSFLEQEDRESHDAVRRLDNAVQRGGLAVVGLAQTMDALQAGQADLLVLAQDLPESDREKLVRQAVQTDTRIETVRGSRLLEKNGGAGCLLRYLGPPVGSRVATVA